DHPVRPILRAGAVRSAGRSFGRSRDRAPDSGRFGRVIPRARAQLSPRPTSRAFSPARPARAVPLRWAMRIPTLFAVLAFAPASPACSTTYQPKRADRMYLVVDSAKLAVRKNGQTVAEDSAFSAMFSCDRAADDTAGVAQAEIKTGYDLARMS